MVLAKAREGEPDAKRLFDSLSYSQQRSFLDEMGGEEARNPAATGPRPQCPAAGGQRPR